MVVEVTLMLHEFDWKTMADNLEFMLQMIKADKRVETTPAEIRDITMLIDAMRNGLITVGSNNF